MTHFTSVLSRLSSQGLVLERVLWIVPRVEHTAPLKVAWQACREKNVVLAPHVQTADRLSTANSTVDWLNLKLQVVLALGQQPALTGGLSGESLWSLAQEYLELAFRLVLLNENQTPGLMAYIQTNQFSEMEAQVVLQLADMLAEPLRALIVQPKPEWLNGAIDQVVWFDDGELIPQFWLQAFFPNTPVICERLSHIDSAKPWQDLAQHGAVTLSVAPDETTQARQAAAQVLAWLQQNDKEIVWIAVVDRLAARRLVAELEQAGVWVDDRTGWRFSTSRVAGWFDGVLNVLNSDGELLALPHPFLRESLALPVPWRIRQNRTLSAWAAFFQQALDEVGLYDMLRADGAGDLFLQGLAQLAATTVQHELSLFEFSQAWVHWAENSRFRPLDVQSPVRMVPLLATRLQSMQRVLVLGCAQSHFQESPPGLLPPSVALELGLPGPKMARIQKISALFDVLNGADQAVLMHGANVGGRLEMLLPELFWLEILLKQTRPEWLWKQQHDDWIDQVQSQRLSPLQIYPLSDAQSIPERVRVSTLDDWAACPLRFGLMHCMPWADDSGPKTWSFEQIRGVFVHKVLEKTARAMRSMGGGDLSVWKSVLNDQAQSAWAALSTQDQWKLYPFLRFFEAIIPRLAGRLIERQAQGWHFVEAEKTLSGQLHFAQGQQVIHWVGRADRVDQKEGQYGLVDVKFKNVSTLKTQLAKDPLSLPQLPTYQMLLGLPVAELSFLALHQEEVCWLPFPDVVGESSNWGALLFEQLATDFEQFFMNTQRNWPARPAAKTCQFCSAFGVCRPDANQGLDDEVNDDDGE